MQAILMTHTTSPMFQLHSLQFVPNIFRKIVKLIQVLMRESLRLCAFRELATSVYVTRRAARLHATPCDVTSKPRIEQYAVG